MHNIMTEQDCEICQLPYRNAEAAARLTGSESPQMCTICTNPQPLDEHNRCPNCGLTNPAICPECQHELARIEQEHAITPEQRADFSARFRRALALSALALTLLSPLTTHAQDAPNLTQCADTGAVTEFGGPILRCADGALLYEDKDGDGIHPETIGRWVEINAQR